MIFDWEIDTDLDDVLKSVGPNWNSLSGANIFITGGTGFIGRWLLETLRYADARLQLNVRATILTRDPVAFRHKAKHLADVPIFTFVSGDVRNFEFPGGNFSHLIHAATDASADLNQNNPHLMFDTVINGTARTLEFAVSRNIGRILNLSSGAVYGVQPQSVEFLREDCRWSPDCTNPLNSYAEGKRSAEMLCAVYGKQYGLNITSARIFAVLGPYLSLDAHFAAGNFIKDAISGKKIVVKSSGSAVRSYLYSAELISILWHLLIRGQSGTTYNVGSQEAVSIKDLAVRIATLIGQDGYEIQGQDDPGWNPGRYVPDVSLLKQEMGLSQKVSLDDAILRTAISNGWVPCR